VIAGTSSISAVWPHVLKMMGNEQQVNIGKHIGTRSKSRNKEVNIENLSDFRISQG